jgi:hypothetical protein
MSPMTVMGLTVTRHPKFSVLSVNYAVLVLTSPAYSPVTELYFMKPDGTAQPAAVR